MRRAFRRRVFIVLLLCQHFVFGQMKINSNDLFTSIWFIWFSAFAFSPSRFGPFSCRTVLLPSWRTVVLQCRPRIASSHMKIVLYLFGLDFGGAVWCAPEFILCGMFIWFPTFIFSFSAAVNKNCSLPRTVSPFRRFGILLWANAGEIGEKVWSFWRD